MNLQKPTYNLAIGDTAREYLNNAKEWYNYDRGHESFSTAAGVVVRAIAEFSANKDGLTLYKTKTE